MDECIKVAITMPVSHIAFLRRLKSVVLSKYRKTDSRRSEQLDWKRMWSGSLMVEPHQLDLEWSQLVNSQWRYWVSKLSRIEVQRIWNSLFSLTKYSLQRWSCEKTILACNGVFNGECKKFTERKDQNTRKGEEVVHYLWDLFHQGYERNRRIGQREFQRG